MNIRLERCDFADPIVVDESVEVPSIDNNVEPVFEMQAISPDSLSTPEETGGCDTCSEFKEITLIDCL
jgi:hypothetical protein